MSELKVEAAKIEYFEGGALIPIKDAGRLTFSDVTLERGATDDFDFFNWMNDVGNAARGPGGVGVVSPNFKDDSLEIVQRDRDNSTIRSRHLIGAFPISYMAGDWDNTADEVVIEQLVMTYDFFRAGR